MKNGTFAEVKFLLDTHAAFWVVTGSAKLGKNAERRLRKATKEDVALCDISLFELSMLERRGRLAFDRAFLGDLGAQVTCLPIVPEIASAAAALPLPQADPFDRIIVATAIHHELTLVTKDSAIVGSGLVKTIW